MIAIEFHHSGGKSMPLRFSANDILLRDNTSATVYVVGIYKRRYQIRENRDGRKENTEDGYN